MSIFDGYKVEQKISTMIKVYPDRVRFFRYADPDYVQRFDLAEYNPSSTKKKSYPTDPDENDAASIRKAKSRVLDMALCNDFDLMATFTFDPKKIDRYDVDAVKRSLTGWINHQRAKYGKFRYIVIPEHHQDGALHFHAMFGGYMGQMVDSGIRQRGRKVYNITSYRMGFTTAVKIDNKEWAAAYVTKYITKEMPKFKNRQRYWCSNGLKRPLRILNPKGGFLDKYSFSLVYETPIYEMLEYRGEMTDKDILIMADYGRTRYDDLTVSER